MNYSSIKKASFWGGIVLFVIILLGHLIVNSFYLDTDLFLLKDERLIPLSVLSLFAGALIVLGMNTNEANTTKKRCLVAGVVGAMLWLVIILSIFKYINSPNVWDYPGILSNLFGDGIEQLTSYLALSAVHSKILTAYYINWLLLSITGSSLIGFAIWNIYKMERSPSSQRPNQ